MERYLQSAPLCRREQEDKEVECRRMGTVRILAVRENVNGAERCFVDLVVFTYEGDMNYT